jgi:hypothetical protein
MQEVGSWSPSVDADAKSHSLMLPLQRVVLLIH